MTGKYSKIILVNPPVHDFAAFDFWAKPMGLLLIAEALKKSGVEPVLIDALDPYHPAAEGLPKPKRRSHGRGKFFEEEIPKPAALKDVPKIFRRHGLPPDRLRRAIADAGPADAAFVTCLMTYWYRGAFEAIEAIREVFPSMPILLGGGYATLCAEHAKRYSGADAVVTGPIESVGELPFASDLKLEGDLLFAPALDLYPRLEYAPILTSRGCPFRCDYCASDLLCDRYESRAPEEIVEEIGRAYERGVRDFAFYDDALAITPEKRLIPMLEEVIRRGWNLRFHVPNAMHAREIDDDLAALMRRAGFVTMRLGVETTAAGSGRRDKKLDPAVLPRVAAALIKAGWARGEVGAYTLAGLPGQTVEEVKRDIKALWEMGLRPYLTEYSPIPGTTLFKEAAETSRYDITNEPLTHNNSILPCASRNFTLDDLQRLKELTWPSRKND